MNLVQIRRYFKDTQVPSWRKLIVVGAVAYVLLPIDLVPDIVPLVGWLDDIGALGAALAFFARDVSSHSAKASGLADSSTGVEIIDAAPVRAQR